MEELWEEERKELDEEDSRLAPPLLPLPKFSVLLLGEVEKEEVKSLVVVVRW